MAVVVQPKKYWTKAFMLRGMSEVYRVGVPYIKGRDCVKASLDGGITNACY